MSKADQIEPSQKSAATRRTLVIGGVGLAAAGIGAIVWRKKDLGARFFNPFRLDQFELPGVPGLVDSHGGAVPGFSSADLKDRLSIVHVWASWCGSCREEHPLLVDLAAEGVAPIYGVIVKDKPSHARQFLDEHGNPYTAVGVDEGGYLQRTLGARGFPSTFVIEQGPRIEVTIHGPLDTEAIRSRILPSLIKLG